MTTQKLMASGLLVSMLALYSPNVLAANAVTAQESQKVNKEILSLQNNISQTFQEYVDALAGAKSGSGNFVFGWDANIPGMGSGEGEISVKNYVYNQKGWDQEQSGTIGLKGKYDAGFFGKGSVDISSFFSLIAKDQDAYVLLKDMSAKIDAAWIDQKDIDSAVDALKKAFPADAYMKLSKELTGSDQDLYELLQGTSLRKIIKNMFDEPLFQAYKKSGNAYALIPSKHACNVILGLNENGPLGLSVGYNCTQLEYEVFVKEFLKLGTMQLKLDGKTSTWTWQTKWEIASDISVSYTDEGVQTLSYVLTPDQKKYPKDGARFSYSKGNEVTFHLQDASISHVMFQGKLSKDNRFTSFDLKVKNEKDAERLTLSLADHKISGKMNIPVSDYDWLTGETSISHIVVGAFAGTTDAQDKLQTANIQIASVDGETKKPIFITQGQYNAGKYNFSVRGYDEYSGELSWKGSGIVEKNHFTHASELTVFAEGKVTFGADVDLRDNKENFSVNVLYMGDDKTRVNGYVKYTGTKSDTARDVAVPAQFQEFDEETLYDLLKDF